MADTKISQLSEKQTLGDNDLFVIASSSNNYKVKGSTIQTFAQSGLTIPTKTSDLTNDSGFITSSDIPALPSNTDLADYDNTTSKFVNETDLSAKQDVIDANNKLSYNYLSDTPTIPDELTDLTDIAINSETLAGGQLLKYDDVNHKWTNGSGSTASVAFQDITGQPTDNVNLATALNGKATGGENLTTTSATNIGIYSTTTSGVLKFKSLVAGSGISLTANVDGNSVEVATNISNASTSTTGLLTSTDWNTFNGKQEPQDVITYLTETSVTIATVEANTRYEFTQPLTALTLTAVDDSNLESELQFTTDAGGCTLTVPNTLKWIGSNTISASKEYIISIKNNVAVLGEIA